MKEEGYWREKQGLLGRWGHFVCKGAVLLGVAFLGLLTSCVGEEVAGRGSLALRVSGGEALREGFPHKEGAFLQEFVDGWTMRFTKVILVLGRIELTHPERKEVVGGREKPVMIDVLAATEGAGAAIRGEADLVKISELPGRRLNLGFDVVSASAEAEQREVEAADAKEMIERGWSFLFAGEAEKGGERFTYRIGLKLPIRYSECSNGKDSTLGIAIESNKETGALIYLHPIHLFWDSLTEQAGKLRFDAFAAVADGDKHITADALARQDLLNLKDAAGAPLVDNAGKRVFYDDGGLLPPDKLNLLEFFKFAVRESIHFNGLGLCKSTLLPL
jgi:hypothetical protein